MTMARDTAVLVVAISLLGLWLLSLTVVVGRWRRKVAEVVEHAAELDGDLASAEERIKKLAVLVERQHAALARLQAPRPRRARTTNTPTDDGPSTGRHSRQST